MIRKIPHRFLFQILLVLFVLPTPTSATVTLTQTSSSGSDTLGSCAVSSSDPNCFSSISPETYEKCTFTSSTAGFLVFQSFDVASPSFIQLGKNEYTGAPNAHYLSADEPVKWSTSYSVDSTTGFEACIEVPNFVCSAGEGVAWGGSSLTCETCPAGTSADAEGKLPCLKCQSGKFTAGTGTQYCQSCPDGTEGGEGAEECYEWCHPTSDHCVNTMQKLFDKVSSESTYVQGDDIMDDGDTLTMAEGTFTCTVPGGTPFPCANGYRMLHITDLSGTINCATDAATCVLDGSNSKRIIDIWNGLSTGKLTFRALKFANGGQSLMKDAGGIYMGTGELDLIMCIFHNCHAYGSGIGGAIYVKAQTNWGDDPAVLNLYAVQFVGNVAPVGQGADIAIPASSVGVTVNIYSSECPSPYQSATIQQGEALDIYNPDSNVITSDDVDAEGTLASWSGCYFARFICPVGRYNPSLSAGSDISDVSECIDCQPGKSASTAGSVGSCMDCAVGTYAASSAMGTCTDCAQGKFGVNAAQSSESACFDCGRGKRGLVPGATSDSCVDCEAGTWSDLAVSSTCVSCEGGKYSDVVASASHSDCVDCSPGKYATPASSVCSICSFGKYSSSTSTSCTNCPAGKYIEDDSVTATLHANYDSCVNCPAGKASDESPDNLCDEICLPGTYSVVGSTACTSCERGKFNEQLMQPSCVACGVGRYNEDKGSVNEAACSLCSAGKASDEETRNSPCPECPEGTATAAIGMAACSSCPAGRFSNVVGSYQCDPCSPGSSSSNSGSISCTQCNPGSFTTATGSVSCEMCPAGQKMSVDGDGCDLCPDGKFSNTGSIVCTTCDATAGFISLAGEAGAAACEYCGPGFYADQTAHECKMCSEGKYSTGGVDSCIVCPSGNTGETRTSCPPCPPGTIVSDDRSSCSPCPRGKYAEFGAEACSMCAGLGQYSSTAGAAFCSTAGAGYFPATNREAVIECPQNSYSIGAVDSCKHCSPGAHSQKGASACEQCSSGRYYSEVNSACESCPRNTFSPSGASDITGCLPCEGGHSAPGAGYCEVCAAGKSYDESQDAACVVCDKGKASMGGDATFCAECNNLGQYSDEVGASVCKTASAGMKPTPERDDVIECPKNTLSIGAADDCTPCSPGGHSQPGSSACEQCSSGKYFEEDGNKCELCPKNTFTILGGTNFSNCEQCPVGAYSLAGSGYCQACPQHMEFSEVDGECVCLASFTRVGVATCTCKAGETLMGTSCEPCEKAKWKAAEGVSSCILCENTLKGSITEFAGSQDVTDCECPSRTFDNLKGECVVIEDGMDAEEAGMTLTGLIIEPGFWRTGPRSVDVRECPVTDACIGGNETEAYCRNGHNGPYCNLCKEGYAKDPFFLCQSCDDSGGSVSLRVAVLMAIVSTLAGITYLMKRRAKKEEERLAREGRARSGESTYKRSKRKLKNGGKIIFSGAQISVSLPSVIPSFTMPENFKETLRTMRVFNMSTFEIFSMGCWTAGFNVYYQVLATTVPIIVICVLLLFMGLAISEHRQGLFTIAIAVTYLTLPTVTTMIFSLFPCDDLDDGQSYLRSDYSISCDGEERTGWVVFGLLMILVFPIGVTSAYWMLLWADREKIRRPIEVREQDEELMTKAFLFEPYKPEYWYFEVVETARRLMMTGVLSTIKPGSFVQLSSGLLMSIGYVVFISNIHPYVEVRDNTIAVLTGCQLVLVFMTASFMKYQTKLEEGEAYELQGLGVMLILSYLIIFVLFLFWAWHQKDEMSRSSTTFATKTIKKLGKKVVSKHSLRTVVSVRGKKMNSSDSGGVELSKRPFDGRVDEDQQVFAYENPMTQDLTTTIGGVSRGESFPISEEYEEEEEEEEDVKPPAIPMRVTSTGLLKLSKEADEGGGGDEDVIPGPPPLPVPEDHVEWSQMWDEEHKAPYWMNKDGVTSTWDRPLGY
ncbi:hypothetical protein TrST_g9108 [Triparma strigata]|uniref:WW domain-containing protein n=1 Tax=Triparma strigata TaxID=1606541 RepID=A0A9W7A2D7_9STRA|nr:hypothetical protein TrST_g9108 [Triparma strigata]